MRPKQRRRGPRKTKAIGKGWTWEGVQDALSADTAKGEGRMDAVCATWGAVFWAESEALTHSLIR